MAENTVKHYAPAKGIYVYMRKHSDKNELIILNGTNDTQVIPIYEYQEILQGTSLGYELKSGKKIDLTKQLTLTARQSMIIEL